MSEGLTTAMRASHEAIEHSEEERPLGTNNDLDDLQRAISEAEEAVAAASHSASDRADKLNDLAGSLQRQFEQIGDCGAFVKAFYTFYERDKAIAERAGIALSDQRHASTTTEIQSTILCRYNSGKLVKENKPLSKTEYIAISHVWGKAVWQDIPEIGPVLVSSEKAKFVEKRLPLIVGTKWFWMDILCVDQSCKEARIAVAQHIPTIFRRAQKTIVVRNSTGFQDCCSHAFGNIFTSEDLYRIRKTLLTHLGMHLEMQRSGESEGLKEEVFERLWVLQEVALSNCIQFVRCDKAPEYSYSVDSREEDSTIVNFLLTMNKAFAFWWGWDDRQDQSKGLEFLRAFLNCGTVSRFPPQRSPPFPSGEHLLRYITNTRRTSKPRDFILAIMPQYGFYTVPTNARDMNFGELLVDCFQQGRKAGWYLQPLLSSDGPRIDSTFSATDNVPEPLFLGDVVKLFLGPFRTIRNRKPGIKAVEVQRAIDTIDPGEIIQILFQCIRDSSTSFDFAAPQERWLRNALGPDWEGVVGKDWGSSQSMYSEDQGLSSFRTTGFDQAFIALNFLRKLTPDSLPPNTLSEEPWLLKCAIRMTAVIACGLGASAYGWSQENLAPVLVKFDGMSILALVSNSVVSPENDPKFFLLDAEGVAGGVSVLMSYNQIRKGKPFYSRGLFPQKLPQVRSGR
jgi:hypothetical protein